MEDRKMVICRLCLGFAAYDECQELDTVSRGMLALILPDINLDISLEPKICQNCYKMMLRCYRFKSSRKNENTETDIKKDGNTGTGTDTISVHEEPLGKKCDFCSAIIDDESLREFDSKKVYFKEVIMKCFPERNIASDNDSVACKICLDMITSQYTFITDCLDTEDKVKNYCSMWETEDKSNLNLYEVVQFILGAEHKSSNPINEFQNETLKLSADNIKKEDIVMEEVHIKSETTLTGNVENDETSVLNKSNNGSARKSLAKISPSTSTPHSQIGKKRPSNLTSGTPVLQKRSRGKQLMESVDPAVPSASNKGKAIPVTKRSVGVQVKPVDLKEMSSVGVQVNLEPPLPVSVGPGDNSVSSSTETVEKRKRFKPRILRKSNKLS